MRKASARGSCSGVRKSLSLRIGAASGKAAPDAPPADRLIQEPLRSYL